MVAANARLDGGGVANEADETDAARAEREQVRGGQESGAVVIDADEIAGAAGGGIVGAAVEQDDGDGGGVQEFEHAGVDFGGARAEFERREEDAGDAAGDAIAGQGEGLIFARGAALLGVRPEKGVAARFGRGGDALADGLEDLGLAEIGDDEAEEETFAGTRLGTADVGAGAGDAVGAVRAPAGRVRRGPR